MAFVGSSGCGKSTCIQLLQRFYDIESGALFIDNRNIQSYNVAWLRTQLGVVNQEPVLFGIHLFYLKFMFVLYKLIVLYQYVATTIYENIRYGRDDVTEQEIYKAAQDANAHDFIMSLPQVNKTFLLSLLGFASVMKSLIRKK